MKISINTKEDSNEDIRKVISLLSTLIEHRTDSRKTSNIFEDSSSNSLNISEPEPKQISSDTETEKGSAFANMFGDNNQEKTEQTTEENKTEKDVSENPKVIQY